MFSKEYKSAAILATESVVKVIQGHLLQITNSYLATYNYVTLMILQAVKSCVIA